MVRKIKEMEECHICGEKKKLTYEHIPPKSSFNDFAQYEINFLEDNNSYEDFLFNGKIRGKIMQNGIGKFALCSNCNNNTGALYGKAFSNFTYQISQQFINQKIDSEKTILNETKYNLFPLRIMKQAISLFLSLNETQVFYKDGTREMLRKFILERNNREFPKKLKLYYYVLSPITTFIRKNKFMIRQDVLNNGISIFASEISFWTSGFILTTSNLHESKNNEIKNLVDITFFNHYEYEEQVELEMELPIYPNHTQIILDFRTKEELYNNSILPDGDILMMNQDSSVVNFQHRKK